MPTKVYLAGPMSGKPQFNIPTFDAAAEDLRGRGLEVVSPAELDDPAFREQCLASADGGELPDDRDTWGTLLARDIKLITDDGIQAIVVLPGWQKSKGALLETFVACLVGIPVFWYDPDVAVLYGVSAQDLRAAHTSVDPITFYTLYLG